MRGMWGRVLEIGRDFPYRVLIRVPAGASLLDNMHEFWRARELTYQTHNLRRKPDVWDYLMWCFVNPMHAHEFRRQFGGEGITAIEVWAL
jgi:hypothetical protein